MQQNTFSIPSLSLNPYMFFGVNGAEPRYMQKLFLLINGSERNPCPSCLSKNTRGMAGKGTAKT